MRRFCIECGKEAAQDHNICIHCGTPLPRLDIPADAKPTGDDEVAEIEVSGQDVDEMAKDGVPAEDAGVMADEVPVANDEMVTEDGATAPPEDFVETPGGAAPSQDVGEVPVEGAGASAETAGNETAATTAETTTSPIASMDAAPSAGAGASPDAEYDASASPDTHADAGAAPSAGADASRAAATTDPSRKKKSGKKNKLIWRIGAIVAILLIGLFVWANNYTSPESVEKRFQKAIDQENVGQLKSLMVHGDGSAIEAFEAEAFLELVKKEGRNSINSLTSTTYDGKFLYLFDSYKIEAQDQVPFADKLENLTYTFNEEEVAVFDEDEDNIAFGPLAPGVYNVAVNFSSEFGELSIEEEITLADPSYQEYTYMDIDIPLAEVSIYVDNAGNIGHEYITVKVGDKDFPIDEEGETGVIGTMLIDGSVTAQVVSSLPWGEVETEPMPIEDYEPWMTAAYLAEDHLKEIKDSVSNFGEQFLEAQATNSTKPVKNVSKDAKEKVALYFSDNYVYSGQLNSIGINEDEFYMNETEDGEARLAIPVQFYISEDYHDIEETQNLEEVVYTFDIVFSYNKDDKSWLIENFDAFSWVFEPTEEWDGSGKLYGPSEKQVKKASEKSFEDEMETFLTDYTIASVDAINDRDFDIVSGYITKDGPRREEARDYIDYLDSKDIYETWIDTELESVEELGKNEWKVTVLEEFEIIRPDSSDQWKFRTVLVVKQIDDELLVDELLSTDRLD